MRYINNMYIRIYDINSWQLLRLRNLVLKYYLGWWISYSSQWRQRFALLAPTSTVTIAVYHTEAQNISLARYLILFFHLLHLNTTNITKVVNYLVCRVSLAVLIDCCSASLSVFLSATLTCFDFIKSLSGR